MADLYGGEGGGALGRTPLLLLPFSNLLRGKTPIFVDLERSRTLPHTFLFEILDSPLFMCI